MEMQSLQDLFLDELKDTLHAENQILKALPRMIKKAESEELREAFEAHLGETEQQVKRLEKVFKSLGVPMRAKTCKGMQGILEEGKEMMSEAEEPVMDALLIAAAQKVEHYEIASYGTLRSYAQLLGNDEAARLLEQTLEEEKATDKLLTALAESHLNVEAAEGDDEE